MVQTGNLRQQLEQGGHESRLSQHLQVKLLLGLDDFGDVPRNNFDGLMISVLNFGLSFEVEAQFQYSLPFGTTEIFPDLAFVVMLEAHAVKLLSQLSVFEFGL